MILFMFYSLFYGMAFMSYISVISCASSTSELETNSLKDPISEAFANRVWKKAEEFSQKDDLYGLGVQHQTFALFRTLYLKSEQYESLIDEIKTVFSEKILKSAEPMGMEMDYLTSLTLSELIESNPDLIIGALNDALSSNHPLNIYADSPVFSQEEIIEDPCHLCAYEKWMEATLVAELVRIKSSFDDGKMTTETIVDVLVLIYKYSQCSVHLGEETDMQINKIIQLVLDYPDVVFECIKAAFEFDFMTFDSFYKCVTRNIRRSNPEALEIVEAKFGPVESGNRVDINEYFKSFSRFKKIISADKCEHAEWSLIQALLNNSVKAFVAAYSFVSLKISDTQDNLQKLLDPDHRNLGFIFEYFDSPWFKSAFPKLPDRPLILLNVQNESRIEEHSFKKLQGFLNDAVIKGYPKMSESIARVLPKIAFEPPHSNRNYFIAKALENGHPRIALALFKIFSPSLEAGDFLFIFTLAAVSGCVELVKAIYPFVKNDNNLVQAFTGTTISFKKWSTAEFFLDSLDFDDHSLYSDLIRRAAEFCRNALKSGFSDTKVMKIVSKFAHTFNEQDLREIYLAGVEISSFDVIRNDVFTDVGFNPDYYALEVAFKYENISIIEYLSEIVPDAANYVDHYAEISFNNLSVQNLLFIIKKFGFDPDPAFKSKWIFKSHQMAVEKNNFTPLFDLDRLGWEMDLNMKRVFAATAEEMGAVEIANYLRK